MPVRAADLLLGAALTIWHGLVTEVWDDGDTFTAELRREGCPDLFAEFSMRECKATVQAGNVFTLDGEADTLTVLDLGTWTQEELDEVMARAKIMAERLRGLCH